MKFKVGDRVKAIADLSILSEEDPAILKGEIGTVILIDHLGGVRVQFEFSPRRSSLAWTLSPRDIALVNGLDIILELV